MVRQRMHSQRQLKNKSTHQFTSTNTSIYQRKGGGNLKFYVGYDFEDTKEYAKIYTARKAAETHKAAVFDESGKIIEDFREKAEPELEHPKQPEEQPETIAEVIDGIRMSRVDGKLRQIFGGAIRIREKPSWDVSAVRGAIRFTEKDVKYLAEVDGKPMYRTVDGYYISGDSKLVEFIAD